MFNEAGLSLGRCPADARRAIRLLTMKPLGKRPGPPARRVSRHEGPAETRPDPDRPWAPPSARGKAAVLRCPCCAPVPGGLKARSAHGDRLFAWRTRPVTENDS